MVRIVFVGLALAASLAACGGSAPSSTAQAALEHQADMYAIDQIEVKWHKAASTHDIDLMMSLWADNATFNIGAQTLSGKDQIRNFFLTKAAPFQPGNHWVSETPAYKIQTTVNGNKGTLYFECHYVDPATRKVKAVVAANQEVARISGTWLITSSISASPELGA
ncbi:MAG: nuclear transport factor 2 family protein [Chloroflexi bacterium]|nr:MAG: nuclear transport factor 2 family protein [Chloroflexota bacterium]TMB84730.1 MAG: nuclear transport factor 2 family protein [Chloroflexota bacterium]